MPEPPEVAHGRVCIGGPGGGNPFRPLDEVGDDDANDADRLPRPQAFKLLQRTGSVLAAARTAAIWPEPSAAATSNRV
jgi:hypothetical protein